MKHVTLGLVAALSITPVVMAEPVPVPAPAPAQAAQDRSRVVITPEQYAAAERARRQVQRIEPVEVPENASAELRAWLEHVNVNADRGLNRGADVGGTSMLGISPGGRGDLPKLAEVLDAAQYDRLAAWNDRGALVVRVVPGSPAETAGILPGDVIVQFAGLWVDAPTTMVRLASRAVVGQEYEVQILRDGEIERTWIVPADRRDLEK